MAMTRMMMSRCSPTNAMLPRKYPTTVSPVPHAALPIALYSRNVG
ncbi:Uncharacterised protein [Mycobacteroides abscessus subsp. abscessus]|nr:Uncharacterised protein [Mycobacteroides abscessus subsp. abscessus]